MRVENIEFPVPKGYTARWDPHGARLTLVGTLPDNEFFRNRNVTVTAQLVRTKDGDLELPRRKALLVVEHRERLVRTWVYDRVAQKGKFVDNGVWRKSRRTQRPNSPELLYQLVAGYGP
jgi:hypothetical protein